MPTTFDPQKLITLRKRAPAPRGRPGGMTQQDLADALGVTRQAVSEWECGRKRPEINTLPRLAEVLGCPMPELFTTDRRSRRPAA